MVPSLKNNLKEFLAIKNACYEPEVPRAFNEGIVYILKKNVCTKSDVDWKDMKIYLRGISMRASIQHSCEFYKACQSEKLYIVLKTF